MVAACDHQLGQGADTKTSKLVNPTACVINRSALTPFIKGIKEAGSVDIDASSRKTTGKSTELRAQEHDEIHVVHTYKGK